MCPGVCPGSRDQRGSSSPPAISSTWELRMGRGAQRPPGSSWHRPCSCGQWKGQSSTCPCPVVGAGCSSGMDLSLCLAKCALAGLWCSALFAPLHLPVQQLSCFCGCSVPCTLPGFMASSSCRPGGHGGLSPRGFPSRCAGHRAGSGWSPGNLLSLELNPLLFPRLS